MLNFEGTWLCTYAVHRMPTTTFNSVPMYPYRIDNARVRPFGATSVVPYDATMAINVPIAIVYGSGHLARELLEAQ